MNRGVRQLTHMFVNYHPGGASSRVVQEFAEGGMLDAFKNKFDGVVIETVVNKRAQPFVQAAYVNNHGSQLSLVDCKTPEGVLSLCQRLADQIGRAPGHQSTIQRKPFAITKTRSLQGVWNSTFNLKSEAEQLAPLLQTQTHIVGLAPPVDAEKKA